MTRFSPFTGRLIRAAIAGSLTFCAAGYAAAQDFTINVPVDLNNMPSEVTAIIVECVAICGVPSVGPEQFLPSNASDAFALRSAPAVVGFGRQVRATNGATGQFHQNVTVSFSSHSGFAPNNVRTFACWMMLRDDQGQEAIPGTVSQDHMSPASPGETLGVNIVPLNYSLVGEFNNPAADPANFGPNACQQ